MEIARIVPILTSSIIARQQAEAEAKIALLQVEKLKQKLKELNIDLDE